MRGVLMSLILPSFENILFLLLQEITEIEVAGPHLCRAEHFNNANYRYSLRVLSGLSNKAQYSSSPSLGKNAWLL